MTNKVKIKVTHCPGKSVSLLSDLDWLQFCWEIMVESNLAVCYTMLDCVRPKTCLLCHKMLLEGVLRWVLFKFVYLTSCLFKRYGFEVDTRWLFIWIFAVLMISTRSKL